MADENHERRRARRSRRRHASCLPGPAATRRAVRGAPRTARTRRRGSRRCRTSRSDRGSCRRAAPPGSRHDTRRKVAAAAAAAETRGRRARRTVPRVRRRAGSSGVKPSGERLVHRVSACATAKNGAMRMASPIGCALTQWCVTGQRMIAVQAGNSPPQQSSATACQRRVVMEEPRRQVDVVRERVGADRRAGPARRVDVDVAGQATRPPAHPAPRHPRRGHPRSGHYRRPEGSRGDDSSFSNSCQRRSGRSGVPPRDSMNVRTRSLP